MSSRPFLKNVPHVFDNVQRAIQGSSFTNSGKAALDSGVAKDIIKSLLNNARVEQTTIGPNGDDPQDHRIELGTGNNYQYAILIENDPEAGGTVPDTNATHGASAINWTIRSVGDGDQRLEVWTNNTGNGTVLTFLIF